jgi:crotonobetainyl-CoA:carnitine CoA-transferase CaiB-like acyl-CoA transferase
VTNAVLSGIRVLDFGRYVAGPYCATLLGYLGADVIRIERREGGEDRFIAPITPSGEGAVFLQTGSNKRSLTLNPGTPEGRKIIAELVKTADVVVANLPPLQVKIDYLPPLPQHSPLCVMPQVKVLSYTVAKAMCAFA